MSAITKPYPLFAMIQWWIDLFEGPSSHEMTERA
jgi:hypothetical protein